MNYKSTGVKWLEEIPVQWEVRKLKYLSDLPIRNGLGESGDQDNPEWPRYIRITDIAGARSLRPDTFRSLPPEVASEAPVAQADILFAAVGATVGKSYLHENENGEACYAGYLVKFSPSPMCMASFISYWTESQSYWDQIRIGSVQSTIPNFSASRYREIVAPIPPLDEQRAIVAYLDRKTGEIDGLIGKQQELINLLRERRGALISRSVTKGLDSGARVKDSGVEWLGEVPVDWVVRPLKSAIRSGKANGLLIKGQMYQEAEDGLFHGYSASGQDIWVDVAEHEHPGIVLSAVGARCGKTFKADGKWTAIANTHVFFAQSGNDRDFLWYLTNDENFWERSGTAQPFVSVSTTLRRLWCFPPIAEQREIAAHLDRETGKIDALTGKAEDAIALLQEYRAALISAAVTGKVDVRGISP